MIRNRTGKDPVLPFPLSSASDASPASSPTALSRALHCSTQHVRSVLRFSRHRRALVSAVLAGSATTAAVMAVVTVKHYGPVPALAAPRPVPTASEALAQAQTSQTKRHRIADALHLPHLSALHPLRGLASWYGSVWNGRKTASGETFDEARLTAAHKTLPMGTVVRVTDVRTQRSVIVRINDRGTLAPGRIIDLSSAAAARLGILQAGTAKVKLEILQGAQS